MHEIGRKIQGMPLEKWPVNIGWPGVPVLYALNSTSRQTRTFTKKNKFPLFFTSKFPLLFISALQQLPVFSLPLNIKKKRK